MFSCAEVAALFERAAIKARNELDIPTEALMVDVADRAKGYIGTYQAGWPALAKSTLEGWNGHPGKIALGYAPPDNPLLREGALRDSIEHEAELSGMGAEGQVGSNDKVALWQELGTSRGIPPRSFLGLSMSKCEPKAQELFGLFALELLTFR